MRCPRYCIKKKKKKEGIEGQGLPHSEQRMAMLLERSRELVRIHLRGTRYRNEDTEERALGANRKSNAGPALPESSRDWVNDDLLSAISVLFQFPVL
jgi:hypothetical protein